MAATTEQSTAFNTRHLPTSTHSLRPSGGIGGASVDRNNSSNTATGPSIRNKTPVSVASTCTAKKPSFSMNSGQHHPSFSITLPPSKTKGGTTTMSRTIVFDDVKDHRRVALESSCGESDSAESQGDAQHQSQQSQPQNGNPPVRRRSVQFMPGDKDTLADHEHQSMLPKTPYPTTDNPMERSLSQKSTTPSDNNVASRMSPSASSQHALHPPNDIIYHHSVVRHLSVSPPSLSSASSSTTETTSTTDHEKSMTPDA